MNSPGVSEQQVGVVASFFQIRNERISDLFQASDIGADEPKVRTGSTGRTIVEGLKRFRLRTLQEARECFAHAVANQRLLSPGAQVIFSVHLHDLQTTSHPDGAEAPITSSTLLSSLHPAKSWLRTALQSIHATNCASDVLAATNRGPAWARRRTW